MTLSVLMYSCAKTDYFIPTILLRIAIWERRVDFYNLDMGWIVKGKSFITCDGGDGYLRKLEDFETDPQIHPSFSEMTPHKIQLLWKFPPFRLLWKQPVYRLPYRFSDGRGGGLYTGYRGNHEYSSYKSCSLQNRCYFSRFPGKVNNKKIRRKNDA